MIVNSITAAALVFAALSSTANAAARNYFSPAIDGVRLDACLSDSEGCGKPAADAFCRREGYAQSILFQREPAMSTIQPSTGKSCEGPSCLGFKQIKCYRPEVAAVQ